MQEPTISLVTYTYNDGDLAADLLTHVKDFTVQPDEIVVVDDGSAKPFHLPDAPEHLRVIHLDGNKGITTAKGTGLSAASGEYLLSMDCDTRLSRDWLERTLAHASRPEVGMVGGSGEHQSGNDLVSRYLSHFGDNHHNDGPVDFIPGNAFLLRREVWEQVGGFEGYADTNCQDHYLCARLKRLGYTLYSDAQARSRHLRRITRTALCKRVWKWCHKPIKKQLSEVAESGDPQDIVTYFFSVLGMPLIERSQRIAELKDPLLYYIELLYIAHTIMDSLDHLIRRGQANESLRRSFIAALWSFFADWSGIRAVFNTDMSLLGHDLHPAEATSDPQQWEDDLFLFRDAFQNGGVMAWLEQQGVAILLREDVEERFDFSSYEDASFVV